MTDAKPSTPAELEASRNATHGPQAPGSVRTGRGWAALLSEYYQQDLPDIPGWLVELMMVEFKLHRAARPFLREQDDYDDAGAYLAFAERNSKETPDAPRAD